MCGWRERVRRRGRAGALASTVRRIATAATLAGLVASAGPALAASGSFAFVWPASTVDACIDPPALKAAVVAQLGHDPFVDAELAQVVLEGRELAPSSTGRRRARLEQRDHEGRVLGARDLDAPSCGELLRSAAFVIVLIVDPDALFREPPPPPTKQVEAPPRARQPDAPPPGRAGEQARPPPHAPPARPWRAPTPPILDAGAGITYGRGLLPGGDIGGVVAVGLSPWNAPLRFDWRGSHRVSLGTPRRQRFSALMQEWRACAVIGRHDRLGGAACAGGAWSAVLPEARGLADGDRAAKAVYGPIVAVGPTLRAGALTVAADVTLFFPRPRWAFSYEDEAGRARTLHELDRSVITTTISVTRTFR